MDLKPGGSCRSIGSSIPTWVDGSQHGAAPLPLEVAATLLVAAAAVVGRVLPGEPVFSATVVHAPDRVLKANDKERHHPHLLIGV